MGRAGRLSVESSGDADEHATARGECPVSDHLSHAPGFLQPTVTAGTPAPGRFAHATFAQRCHAAHPER